MEIMRYYDDLRSIERVYSDDHEAAEGAKNWVVANAGADPEVEYDDYIALCNEAETVVGAIRERLGVRRDSEWGAA